MILVVVSKVGGKEGTIGLACYMFFLLFADHFGLFGSTDPIASAASSETMDKIIKATVILEIRP